MKKVKLLVPRVVDDPKLGPVSQTAGQVVEMQDADAARAVSYQQAEYVVAKKKATKKPTAQGSKPAETSSVASTEKPAKKTTKKVAKKKATKKVVKKKATRKKPATK